MMPTRSFMGQQSASLFRGVDVCRPESMKEAGSGEDSSDNMLTLDALQVSSSFQVTRGVVNVECGHGYR
jgi:hypothetical protein